MVFTLPEVLVRVRPGAKWRLPDIHDYETLEWNDESQTKPTLEELTVNYQELIDAQPFKYFRQERNKRLTEVDWVFSTDYQIDDDSYQQWLTYRKALRDLPSLTEDPENPVWPEQPAMPSGNTTNLSKRQEHLVNENIAMKGKITRLERKTTDQELELLQLKRRLNKLERPA
jgi:hypothetical protein